MADLPETTQEADAWEHVAWLARGQRHTTASDRLFQIADAHGWVRRTPGIMGNRAEFLVELVGGANG